MKLNSKKTLVILPVLGLFLLLLSGGRSTESADHADAPLLAGFMRHDARMTDLYAFRDKNDLVIALCTDPTVPGGVTEYAFQDDVTFEINIDNTSRVSYRDQTANQTYGGTVLRPGTIDADIKLTVTFSGGEPVLQTSGMQGPARKIQMFAGLRDDPFIRGPRLGRNVAAIVLKVPLHMVKRSQSELLIWATSTVPEMSGMQGDMAARALRSMFPENDPLNYMPPNQQTELLGVPPDVIIYDLSRPARFPNGRALTDDVVDLVGDPRVLSNDAPFPTANDVQFLNRFPYLAPPQ